MKFLFLAGFLLWQAVLAENTTEKSTEDSHKLFRADCGHEMASGKPKIRRWRTDRKGILSDDNYVLRHLDSDRLKHDETLALLTIYHYSKTHETFRVGPSTWATVSHLLSASESNVGLIAKQILVHRHLYLVFATGKKYARQWGEWLDWRDLIYPGIEGIENSIEKYDLQMESDERGFRRYVLYGIKTKMVAALRKEAFLFYVPSHRLHTYFLWEKKKIQLEHHLGRRANFSEIYHRFKREAYIRLQNRLERKPTREELKNALPAGFLKKSAFRASLAKTQAFLSSNAIRGTSPDHVNNGRKKSLFEDPRDSYLHQLIRQSLRLDKRDVHEDAFVWLTPFERTVLKMTYGFWEPGDLFRAIRDRFWDRLGKKQHYILNNEKAYRQLCEVMRLPAKQKYGIPQNPYTSERTQAILELFSIGDDDIVPMDSNPERLVATTPTAFERLGELVGLSSEAIAERQVTGLTDKQAGILLGYTREHVRTTRHSAVRKLREQILSPVLE